MINITTKFNSQKPLPIYENGELANSRAFMRYKALKMAHSTINRMNEIAHNTSELLKDNRI